MASSLKYNDFFELLDMLGEDGMDLGDDLPDEANAKRPKTAAAVIRKHPVGCRQRNVARRRVCPSVDMDLSQVRDPEIRASLSSFKQYLEKERDEAERKRLAYLKNAV
jgi:hypothetical protein